MPDPQQPNSEISTATELAIANAINRVNDEAHRRIEAMTKAVSDAKDLFQTKSAEYVRLLAENKATPSKRLTICERIIARMQRKCRFRSRFSVPSYRF